MTWKNILIIALVLVVLYFIWYNSNRTCYYLPKDHNPEKFGKFYWFALHDIVNRIPCPGCRQEAVPMLSFMHDLVNFKIEKPLFDKENFYKHVEEICKLKK